ncbi:baculoviral IAP repeat-containing protein 2-like [Ylistrum balloti]|uniref:baculoviral IAP repeat-containing protein 2-like n=1 Tax=Ylistrum balloti TaxID=509963 RepID=UPI00290591D0|nr:baculoviral IAP repeat-containing protein 2-like [Ylistrum balloti]
MAGGECKEINNVYGSLSRFEMNTCGMREASFRQWPHRNIPTGPLVRGGFSCMTPETSTVRCTDCGLEVDASNLNGTSPYTIHAHLSPECLFFYPAHPYRLESERRQSFLYWNGYRGTADVDDLVKDGFYLTECGQDNVRCFCCDIGLSSLSPVVNIRQEHGRLSPGCVFRNHLQLMEE